MDEYEDAVADAVTDNEAFFNRPVEPDWTEHDHHFDRHGRVQYLLSEIQRELAEAQKEECLNFIVDDPSTKDEFLKLSNFFPSSALWTPSS